MIGHGDGETFTVELPAHSFVTIALDLEGANQAIA